MASRSSTAVSTLPGTYGAIAARTRSSTPASGRWGTRVRGRQTTSTSAKVDHVSVPSQSKAVDDFQINTLQRAKKPTAKSRKRHTCPVCRRVGHHARTCHDVLLDENAERADSFFARLIETGRVDSYVASLAKRERHNFVEHVIGRINLLSEAARSPDSPARTDITPQKVIE